MSINCKISNTYENLYNYSKLYSWIPLSLEDSDNILSKKKLRCMKKNLYNSYVDYILINIFNAEKTLNCRKKIITKNKSLYKNKYKFTKNIHANIPSETNYYIFWLYTKKTFINNQIIKNNIYEELVNIVGNENFNYIYYENSLKKNLENIHILHVFWILI